jgi:FkbM family methyltransferase
MTKVSEHRRELEVLLSEDVTRARTRAQNSYDELAGPHGNRIVLFGAGGLGRKTLHGLRKLGVEPVAFCDSNSRVQGKEIDGVTVYSPEDAARRFGRDTVFLITIWGGRSSDTMPRRFEQLAQLNCRWIIPFGFLFWKHPEIFLPHYPLDMPHHVLESRDDIIGAFEQWNDESSRKEFVADIRWRLTHDFAPLPAPVEHEIYFPDDLVEVRSNEAFVDCGAFDGDTAATFLGRQGKAFCSIDSFEPDPANFAKLAAYRDSLEPEIQGRFRVHSKAVSDATGRVRFAPTGTEASVMGEGELELDCVALDDLPDVTSATWLKMDIEGAEPLALAGSRSLISRNVPVLAICVYHQQAHVWQIPRIVAGMSDQYASYLRPHLLEGWDLVYYGIPRNRLK